MSRSKTALVSGGAVVVVGAVVALFASLGELEPFIAFATVGTAMGTLVLALYTYRLARSTRESVEGGDRLGNLARDQLSEVRAQRDLLQEQARKAGLQAEATQRLADASELSTVEAARARIDAISPLLHLKVSLLKTEVRTWQAQERQKLATDDGWYEPQLKGLTFEVSLAFVLKNTGTSPGQVALNHTLEHLQGASAAGLRNIDLDPGETYRDVLVVCLAGSDAKSGKQVHVSLTYDGLLSGEVIDRVEWNGWVTPLKEIEGKLVPNDPSWVINAAGATVIRSYPNLERPEEMAAIRARLLDPTQSGTAS